MNRAAIQVEGGKLLVNAIPSGVLLTVHTGSASYSLRLSRQAAAQMGDVVAQILTAPTSSPLADAVDAALEARTFRDRVAEVPR